MNKTTLILPILLTAFSCDPGEETPEMLCTPGQSDACACENGLEGAQVCAEDGMAFGVCMCEEPPPACSPGEMDACVCDGQELGMRECGEDSVFGECVCENDTSNGDHIPGTQWVLRDKDGNAVPAVFEPVCPKTKQEQCGTSLDEKTYPCVFIHYLNGNPVWIAYDLATGTPHGCYPERSEWSETNTGEVNYFYDNNECKGPPYRDKLPSKVVYKNTVEFVGGKIYRVDMLMPGVQLTNAYRFSGQECIYHGDINLELWKMEELSADMMNAFPNHPYQIAIE